MNRRIYTLFENISSRNQLILGIFITIAGSLLGYGLHLRYFGAFKITTLSPKAPFYMPLLDNMLIILITLLCLFLAGLLINRRTRALDILNAILISRGPLYLGCLFNINGFMMAQSALLLAQVSKGKDAALSMPIWPMLLMSSGLTLLSVLSIWLLFAGFKTATNGKGAKVIWLFVLGLIATLLVVNLSLASLYTAFDFLF